MKLSLRFNHPKYSDEELNKSIFEIVEENLLLSMASIFEGKESYINTVFYCYNDKLDFYFLSPSNTQHIKNIQQNNSVALAVYDSHQKLAGKRGLQIFGICRLANRNEMEEGIELYSKRFAWLKKFIKTPVDFDKGIIESRMYIIKAQKVKIFDEPNFGAEKWVTVQVK